MDRLKVCFVGVGSIARRHIRNLHTVCAERGINLTIDAVRTSVSAEPVEGLSGIFHHPEEVPRDYDVVFITNPTACHLDTLKTFHEFGKHFFIEKPVVMPEQMEQARAFLRRHGSIYYVACPLRYNAVIRYIKNMVKPSDVLSVRCISSSYLPDWRPGQDYRKTYSASRELGGGVSVDLIHEWDYLTFLFGMPEKILQMQGHLSTLEINSEDYAVYLAQMSDKIVELHLDYFGRSTIREVQLFTREDTITGDLVHNRLRFLRSGKELDFKENRDDSQRRELEHFLDLISGKEPQGDDYLHALGVLALTQGELQTL